MPLQRELRLRDARRERGRKVDLSGDVDNRRPQRVVAVGRDSLSLETLRHERLGAGPEPRADEDAFGTQKAYRA